MVVLAAAALWVLAQDTETEKQAIIRVIEDSYMNGIGNTGDADAIRRGFHPEFNLLGLKEGQLTKLPIEQWILNIGKQKEAGKYPPKEKVTFKYPMIDVVGTAAVAKIAFYSGSRHVYTDFLSLYKFKDGWKIVNKIYYQHPQPVSE